MYQLVHTYMNHPGEKGRGSHNNLHTLGPALLHDKDTPLSVPIVPSPLSTMVVSRMQTAPAAGTGSSAVLAKLMEKL